MSEWIKLTKDLPRKREILLLSKKLKINEAEAIGLCFKFWVWADSETEDGILPRCNREIVDYIVGKGGFAEAMIDPQIGWLLEDSEKLIIPNWDYHNSKSAKRRAMRSRRQEDYRVRHGLKPRVY